MMNLTDAHNMVKEAMKDVKQEMVIVLDGEHHLVYIHNINIEKSGQVTIDFSTPSEGMKDMLLPHVEACLKQQYLDYLEQEKTRKWKLSRLFSRT